MKKLKNFQESKIICRKSKTVEWIHKYMKGNKNVCRKRNIYEGKQKYLKANENIWKKKFFFEGKQRQKILEGKQKALGETLPFKTIVI